MRLSIHDNDDNLGNIGAAIGSLVGLNLGGSAAGQVQSGAAREVVIEIKGVVSRGPRSIFTSMVWKIRRLTFCALPG